MRILGLEIRRIPTRQKQLTTVSSGSGGWWPLVREPYTGAWQRNQELSVDSVLSNGTLWCCITGIAGDISKLPLRLIKQASDGVWVETENSAYSPVLRSPNRYQNHIQFVEHWLLSKLIRGNTYVLKVRDERGVVSALYILDSSRVQVLVAPDGSVFYQLGQDMLSGIDEHVVVPAREIIHDRMFPIFHPLVGISPIFACNLSANQARKIQENSEQFFQNLAQPGGILTAPGIISNETAERLERNWETKFAGSNRGRIAALGDGLKFEPMAFTFQESQLIEQLNLTVADICRVFHYPIWKAGGPMPAYGNVQAANVEYYGDALQLLMEELELCLDRGLALGPEIGVDFDTSYLLRMDSATQMDIAVKAVGGGIYSPNDGRAIFDKMPVQGGATPYLQQQNYSLAALDRRDQMAPAPATDKPAEANDEPADQTASLTSAVLRKAIAAGLFQERQRAA